MKGFLNDTITNLIKNILTEDVGYSSDNFTFLTSQKSLGDDNGGKKLDKSKIIFRLPNKNEINDSGIESSDYQLPALTIYSYVMTQLGLSNRGAVRSKKIPLVRANTREVNRYKTILSSVINSFGKNEPVETFYNALQHSLNAENEKLGINIASVFDTLKTWPKLNDREMLLRTIAAYVRGKYGSDSAETDKKTLDSLNRKINDYSERYDDASNTKSGKLKTNNTAGAGEYAPSDNEVQMVKKIYTEIQPIIKRGEESGMSPKAYIKQLTNADSFKSILKEPVMDGIRKNILSFTGTCGEFANNIVKYLQKQEKGSEKVHAKTVVDTEVKNKLNEIGKELKAQKVKEGFTFDNFLKYEIENNPSAVKFLENTFGVSAKELKNKFSSFEEFNKALYSPENIKKIYSDLGVKVRARAKGETRKGRELQVDARFVNKQIANLERKADEQKETIGKIDSNTAKRIKELKQKAKQIVSDAKNKRLESGEEDDGSLDVFDARQKNAETHENEIEYMTWAFDVRSQKQDTLNFIAKKLNEILSNYNKYINIDAFDSNNDEKCTTFTIDYPKASKIFKAFRDKPEITDQIILWVKQQLKKELGKNIKFELDNSFVNVPQEESYDRLDNGEAPEDAWEDM